jgi:hypothetical protein
VLPLEEQRGDRSWGKGQRSPRHITVSPPEP